MPLKEKKEVQKRKEKEKKSTQQVQGTRTQSVLYNRFKRVVKKDAANHAPEKGKERKRR